MRTQALLTLLVCAGCVGVLGDSSPDGGGPPPGTDPGDPRLLARVWRLTPAQYDAEIQRLFPGAPTVNLPEGASEFGLTNISETFTDRNFFGDRDLEDRPEYQGPLEPLMV